MHQTQRRLLELLDDYNLGEMSLREIGRLLGEEHPQKVSHHLQQLEKRGLIVMNKSDSLITKVKNFTPTASSLINVPIIGSANCGPAKLLAEENLTGYLKLSKSIVKYSDIFAIKAEGDSMNKANINGKNIESGDYVLVNGKDKSINHGDYVLAVVDSAANIKRFYKEPGAEQIVLVSESESNYPPIYIHSDDYSDFLINGKVVDVIKPVSF